MSGSGQYLVGKEPFRIGVSYWPRRAAHKLWQQFDVDEVQEDFSILAELGANLAQVTLPWVDFQNEPERLRCSALAHLLGLCDAAASEGIRLELRLFTDPLGAPDGLPPWLSDPALGLNLAGNTGSAAGGTSPVVSQAAMAFAQCIARTVGNHPAVWAYNLGSRPMPLEPTGAHEAGNVWLDRLTLAIRDIDPKHLVTCSVGGTALTSKAKVQMDELCSTLDHSTIDGTGLADELDPIDTESQASFSCALATALTGKPCLVQQQWHSQSSTRTLLVALHQVGAIGAVIGSFSDLPSQDEAGPRQGGWVQRGQGLLNRNGELHDHAEAIREFAQSKPVVNKAFPGPLSLNVTTTEYYQDPGLHLKRLYGEFRTWVDSVSDD